MQASGIQIDGAILRKATVKQSRSGLRIVDLQSFVLEDSKVKPLYFKNSETLSSGLSSNDLIIRKVPIPTNLNQKMKRAVILQIEAQLHLKPEELLTVPVLSKDKSVTTFSTTRNALTLHLKEFMDLHLDPERVGAIPAALMAFVHWRAPKISSYFLIDVGQTNTNCIWVEDNELQKAHVVHLEYHQNTFQQEHSKILHSFQCQRPLIVTGENSKEFLSKTVQDCITEEKNIGLSIDEQCYASSLGLAIDYLVNRKHPIQFRIDNDLSSRNWQKLGRFAAILFASSIVFCGMILGISSWWMNARETKIIHTLETWTSKDPALHQELFSSNKDTKDLVNQWLQLIEKNSNDYRFLMKAPRVATVLDWLTHHPLIESFRLAGDPISFEQIRYQLVSYPHIDALNDPTLAKVEIEFKVTSPLHARKFHETLLKGDGPVDASREITWDVLSDHYKVSFYLKNGHNDTF